jgi:hypothetical protein
MFVDVPGEGQEEALFMGSDGGADLEHEERGKKKEERGKREFLRG